MPVPTSTTTTSNPADKPSDNNSTTNTNTSGQENKEPTPGSMEATAQQKENDRLYEERMEEEYAKREGGA